MIIYSYSDSKRKNPTKKAIKECIKFFLERGKSTHSRYGILLVHLLNYCERKNIRYELTAWPEYGYVVKKIEEKDD